MNKFRIKAAASGLTHYIGKQCKTCGNALKYTSTGNCVVCSKASVVQHRQKIKHLLNLSKDA